MLLISRYLYFLETLRMYPPAIFLNRLCTEEYDLPHPSGSGKITIKKGMSVVIPLLGIHHDPAYYPNPDKFDPDRFNEDQKNSRPKCSFLGFGEGPRICLGWYTELNN